MWQLIHRWHRRFGIISALFVVLLVLTGLLLNHTETLNLDSSYVQSDLLLDIYDISPGKSPVGFQAGDHWISQVGERVYYDDVNIAEGVNSLVGAVHANNEIIIGFDGQLLIVDEAGTLIERLTGADGVPAGMQSIGAAPDGQIVIRGSHGDYQVRLDALDWHEEEELVAAWSVPANIPDALLGQLLTAYRGKGLSYERLLLDLHSGRLMGNLGIYIIDAAALLFLFLAVTGIWMWFKRA